jgi:hypothetical protein
MTGLNENEALSACALLGDSQQIPGESPGASERASARATDARPLWVDFLTLMTDVAD